MIRPPDYFAGIRGIASQMWNQLDADPHLAGPWHQLFRQVQSPRHVLSELLQNADDAGATERQSVFKAMSLSSLTMARISNLNILLRFVALVIRTSVRCIL